MKKNRLELDKERFSSDHCLDRRRQICLCPMKMVGDAGKSMGEEDYNIHCLSTKTVVITREGKKKP